MKTLLLLLAALPILAHGQAVKLNEAAAKARLDVKVERTTAAAPASDQGADRSFTPTKEISRSYERDFVIVKKSDGSTEKLPTLDLPVLFVRGKTDILDAQSRENLRTLANVIRDLEAKDHARFTIEGHTSAEGDSAANQILSEQRAKVIREQLALLLGQTTAGCLSPKGFGSTHARSAATAAESALQQDRRVLVVKTK